MIYSLRIWLIASMVLVCFPGVAQQKEWKEGFYPDGKLRYKGNFVNGQPVGEIIHYYPNGRVKAVMQHSGNEVSAVLHSMDELYTASGKYLDKKKNGEWKYRKENQLVMKEEYLDNRLDGTVVKYSASGAVIEIKNWKTGVLSGEWKLFYDNGRIRLQASWLNGKLDGVIKSYDYEGMLIVEGSYKNNQKEGTWCYYDKAGKLEKERTYRQGVAEGGDFEESEACKQVDALLKANIRIPDPLDFMDNPATYLRLVGE